MSITYLNIVERSKENKRMDYNELFIDERTIINGLFCAGINSNI